ncbi:Morphology and auto-aggregation control protein [Hartmannibacter diazotrophicus]|uniref:Morphology and auto-aggregation control protein n=1 Tax=Hartmannibacter diazotrophicus TaxID=1482074 RepID=A0A2C9DC99_9HYPH|nr:LysR family transcriptional regulator [Hartmannibacter diazotrophicus]SON57758.1 Morphology and auto-aggregation control protein [Hartmannibacter diazotrophicus]
MIKTRQLIYLRKAIETGNITLAARELNVAQTALGFQIRSLEDELGVVLLERHSRGVAPTAAGLRLDDYAGRILALVDEARQSMREFATHGTVSMSMGVTPSIMRLVGDQILTDLAREIPNVALHLVEEFSFVLSRMLKQGELTCALTFATDIGASLLHRALLDEDLCCLTAPDRSNEAGTMTFRQVLAQDLALTGRDDVVSRLVGSTAARLGIPLQVAYEVQSLRAVKNLVAKGIAATIMPYGAAEGELRAGTLRAHPIVEPSLVRTLSLVYPAEQSGIVETPEFTAFVGAITDRLLAAEGPAMRRV